jgi:hypothetical protein
MPAGSVPGCSTATGSASLAPDVHPVLVKVPGNPFGIAITQDGHEAFVALGRSVAVFRLCAAAPALVRQIAVPGTALGETRRWDGHLARRPLAVCDQRAGTGPPAGVRPWSAGRAGHIERHRPEPGRDPACQLGGGHRARRLQPGPGGHVRRWQPGMGDRPGERRPAVLLGHAAAQPAGPVAGRPGQGGRSPSRAGAGAERQPGGGGRLEPVWRGRGHLQPGRGQRACCPGRPALLGLVPAGQFPREMAVAPDGRTLLVGNYLSGQLEAVDVASLP